AIDIAQQRQHLLERSLLQAAVMLQAVLGALFELVQRPSGLGDADDGDVHSLIADEVLQRGKNLFVSQVARGPEEYECVRHSVCRHIVPVYDANPKLRGWHTP